MNRDIEAFGLKAFWQRQSDFRRQGNVKHAGAAIAIKMAMLRHVRAKMRRPSVQRDLPHQAALNQRIQAVINCGHRDIRHPALGPDKHLLGGRVIAFVQQHGVHVLALGRETKPAARQPLVETLIGLFIRSHSHGCQYTKPCLRVCQYLE